MKKILTVVGARPQFIKASVVSHAISQTNGLHEVLVHTGQHFDPNMSEVFFGELGMQQPAYTLDINGGSHGEMTARMLVGIETLLQQEKPDAVMVYGDTNSTLAGALAAVKLHIPVAHVEAGLRSFNMRMPEEINRILTDRISRWLFTPTEAAVNQLRAEGVQAEKIIPVGDVMYDVALHHGARVKAEGGVLKKLGLAPRSYVLVTVHRAENTDNPQRLNTLVEAIKLIAASHPVVLPLHPRTRAKLEQNGQLPALQDAVHLMEPVGYLDMVQLEKFAAAIATDSGGVQKEAFFYGVPCVTLREESEWTELLTSGWNRLAPVLVASDVAQAALSAIGSKGTPTAPYGCGDAAPRIAQHLLSTMGL